MDNPDIPGLTYLARNTVKDHLALCVLFILHFQFVFAFAEFSWAIQRVFLIGDYAKGGYFEQHGIDWRASNE